MIDSRSRLLPKLVDAVRRCVGIHALCVTMADQVSVATCNIGSGLVNHHTSRSRHAEVGITNELIYSYASLATSRPARLPFNIPAHEQLLQSGSGLFFHVLIATPLATREVVPGSSSSTATTLSSFCFR